MIDDLFLRALAAAGGVALAAGPLGCFVVWRRMAFFGDTMAHSALVGVALGLLLGVAPGIGIVAVGLVLALFLGVMRRQRRLADDTLLGIFSHTALATGVIAMSTGATGGRGLVGFLFGDVLSVSDGELLWIWLGALAVIAVLIWQWRPLLAVTVSETLARAEDIAVDRVHLLLMALIALVIALAIKVVGVLLVTALLVIPAASARQVAGSPEGMAVAAALAGLLSVAGGVAASFAWDWPSGPTVVLAASAVFTVALLWRTLAGPTVARR